MKELKAIEMLNHMYNEENFRSIRPQINEAIAELEAQEAKSCEGCKSEGFGVLSYPCECCSRTLNDEYEPKVNE